MEVFEAIKKRKSIRRYLDKPVEEEKLLKVLEAARLAPSANNRQEWRFVVVKDKETRQKLMGVANNQSFVGEAPIVIACCSVETKHVMSCGQFSYPIDVAIAIDHMTLVAVEQGLGTCWVGSFYEDQAKKILGISQNVRVVELLTLGYPADEATIKKSRLPLEKIVIWEKWGGSRN